MHPLRHPHRLRIWIINISFTHYVLQDNCWSQTRASGASQWINKNIIDTNDVEGEKGWVKEIPSQLSLRPGVKWMAALPHLLPICQVVKHVGGLLRSSDPQITIGDLTHQSVTNTRLKIQVDLNPKHFIQHAKIILDDEAALPRHVNCISTWPEHL